ncbi:peptidase U32 family protein, partial [Bacillus mycoides]|uniref:peptidase U32 family protein n=1 Tax=Bacillus mycoides TaxID=1405 RepID=UPI0028491ACD|nr:U32 family peptidase [Bacillus mycoides]
MKKPELLVTPRAVADIEPLAKAGADAVMVGEQKFGLRLAGEFSRGDVKQAVNIAQENGVKVYVAMNTLFHNDKVEEVTDYVAFLN